MNSDAFDGLADELSGLTAEPWSAAAKTWKLRAVELAAVTVGEDDRLFRQLDAINFAPYRRPLGTSYAPGNWQEIFEAARVEALGVLKAMQAKVARQGNTTSQAEDPIQVSRLHPLVVASSATLVADGHYSSAVLEAFKAVEIRVREVSGIVDKHGSQLMAAAFSEERPILPFNALRSQSERDEQEGFKLLFMGASKGIRNPKAHEIVEQEDADRVLDYLGFASLLMRRLDDAEQRL